MQHIVINASTEEKEEIIEELLTIKEKNIVDDSKLQIISKSEIKSELGRSPDKADALSMRMWWLIKGHHDGSISEEEEVELAN